MASVMLSLDGAAHVTEAVLVAKLSFELVSSSSSSLLLASASFRSGSKFSGSASLRMAARSASSITCLKDLSNDYFYRKKCKKTLLLTIPNNKTALCHVVFLKKLQKSGSRYTTYSGLVYYISIYLLLTAHRQ